MASTVIVSPFVSPSGNHSHSQIPHFPELGGHRSQMSETFDNPAAGSPPGSQLQLVAIVSRTAEAVQAMKEQMGDFRISLRDLRVTVEEAMDRVTGDVGELREKMDGFHKLQYETQALEKEVTDLKAEVERLKVWQHEQVVSQSEGAGVKKVVWLAASGVGAAVMLILTKLVEKVWK